jgi:hypothetical protein
MAAYMVTKLYRPIKILEKSKSSSGVSMGSIKIEPEQNQLHLLRENWATLKAFREYLKSDTKFI